MGGIDLHVIIQGWLGVAMHGVAIATTDEGLTSA